MRSRRSQMQLFVMILLIVVLILFRMMITRAGDAAIERVKKADEDRKLREEVQKRLDAEKDPLMEELQRRVDAAHDPLEDLKPKSAPEAEGTAPPAPPSSPAPAQPSADSPSR